jgi:hypothetical protein
MFACMPPQLPPLLLLRLRACRDSPFVLDNNAGGGFGEWHQGAFHEAPADSLSCGHDAEWL